MTSSAIIKEIDKLPLSEKLLIIERAVHSIRKNKNEKLTAAVDALYQDYVSDKELTIFSQLDTEPFYEAR